MEWAPATLGKLRLHASAREERHAAWAEAFAVAEATGGEIETPLIVRRKAAHEQIENMNRKEAHAHTHTHTYTNGNKHKREQYTQGDNVSQNTTYT